MKARKTTAGIIAAAVLLSSVAMSLIPLAFLSEYPWMRVVFAVAMVTGGVAVAAILYLVVMALGKRRRDLAVLVCLVLGLLLLPFVSMMYPGTVTYARFGLTVYGIVPVPFLDVKIGPRGFLWFRDKTHRVSLDEARSVLSPDTEVLVIGNGWNGAVTVEPGVRSLEGVRVEILPTPDAFKLYNRCRSEGKAVALIAHSTC